MINFGPSGNSDSFYAQGYKSSLDMPAWLKAMGLSAYEYSLARGMRLRPELAVRLGEKARENGIVMSVHGPYYINLASEDPNAIEKSGGYLLGASRTAVLLGARRVVFHPGSPGGGSRQQGFANIKRNLGQLLEKVKQAAPDVNLCPETMGKKNQIGSLDEILELCLLDPCLIPTLDFGHLHAVGGGALKAKEDYKRVFERLMTVLGRERGQTVHIHYSRIEYTEKGGEKRHWTFDDTAYGPEFEPLAECLAEYGMSATVICESRGKMAEDALKVKNIYDRIRGDYLFNLENI